MAFGHLLDPTELRSYTACTYTVTDTFAQDWIRVVAGFGGVEGCFPDRLCKWINSL